MHDGIPEYGELNKLRPIGNPVKYGISGAIKFQIPCDEGPEKLVTIVRIRVITILKPP